MHWTAHEKNGVLTYTAPVIAAKHAFTTRRGGVSTGALESLNLSVRRGDTAENVRENWARLAAATGIPLERVVYARQVHSAVVHIARREDAQPPELEPRMECDGFVTNVPGLPLAVFMADCIPVLLHDPAAGVIAAVHCGWRSTVQDILGAAVSGMEKLGAEPARLCAAIGPGIGACCFEVGREVVDGVVRLLGEAETLPLVRTGEKGKFFLDLRRANAVRLRQLGVPEDRISCSALCTMCSPDVFWSHRRTAGQRGVQAAVITL